MPSATAVSIARSESLSRRPRLLLLGVSASQFAGLPSASPSQTVGLPRSRRLASDPEDDAASAAGTVWLFTAIVELPVAESPRAGLQHDTFTSAAGFQDCHQSP